MSFSPAILLLDAILVGVAVEGLLLALLWRTRRIGVAPRPLAATLLAGGALVAALRVSLDESRPIAAWLLPLLSVALVAHIADLAMRWRSRLRGSDVHAP